MDFCAFNGIFWAKNWPKIAVFEIFKNRNIMRQNAQKFTTF